MKENKSILQAILTCTAEAMEVEESKEGKVEEIKMEMQTEENKGEQGWFAKSRLHFL